MNSGKRRTSRWAAQANRAAHQAAQRIDDTSGEATGRAAAVIVSAVRLLRWPTALAVWIPVPFILITFGIGWLADGAVGWVIVAVAALMAAIVIAFGVRRKHVLAAVGDPDALATELRIMVNLTGRVDQAEDVFGDIAGGDGWQVFSRLRGVWRGANLPARWLGDVGELPRARYFAPPKIGTTVTLAIAAAWLVPISIVVTLLAAIGALAGSI